MEDENIYIVVGYRNSVSQIYPELRLYGFYKTAGEAKERIFAMSGVKMEEQNIVHGKYTLWINKVMYGEANRLPNSGANEQI
jgi:hypothetical protein